MAKLKEKLNLTTLLLFNGYILSLNKDSIALHQKGQGKKINIININSPKDMWSNVLTKLILLLFINLRLSLIYLLLLNTRNQLRMTFLP
jgi:hypothetical protein